MVITNMDHNKPSSSTDPLLEFDNNDPMIFEDELFQQVLMSCFPSNNQQQLDQDQAVQALFVDRAPTPTPTPAPTPAPTPIRVVKEQGRAKNKKKEKRRLTLDVERHRRQEMASLHSHLRSLLPADYIKGKRSMSDHLQEAVRYIKDLEGRIKGLNVKRDELILMKRSPRCCTSSNSSGSNQNKHVTTVKLCGQGFIEIVVNNIDIEENQPRFFLSKLLHFLGKQGLLVVNCVSSRADNHLIHSIQAQVDDGRDIDLSLLQKQLTDYS